MSFSVIAPWVLSAAVAYFGKYMVSLWRSHKEEMSNYLKGLDDKLLSKVNSDRKTFEWWDQGVDFGVSFMERFAGSSEFWRTVFRAIQFKQPERLGKYQAELMAALPKDGTVVIQQVIEKLSPDFKEIINTVKHEGAEKLAEAFVESKEAIETKNMTKAVAKAAVVMKEDKLRTAEPITKSTLERLIEESKARQEKLKS